jgi:hypothetical protein
MKNLVICCAFLLLTVPCQAQVTCDPNIPADVNNDCLVDFHDFALIASNWHQAGPTEPNQSWVARYNGPMNNSDKAAAVIADDHGNVYVTGESVGAGGECDYATIKYDSDGNEVWLARYDGDANSSDGATAIALDGAGNVYVTGYSKGPGTDADYATIKYDADGNEVWVTRYDGEPNKYDKAAAIAVDDSCNVYVTGCSDGPGTGADYVTIKYDADGNEVWAARYNGPAGNGSDKAWDLVIDDACNVYVTGSSKGTFEDYATVKYDADGNEVWVRRYNGPGNGRDAGKALTIDDACNVYVTGYAYVSDTNWCDYATIKYTSDGNELWVRLYDGCAYNSDEASDIAVDRFGGVYVTGLSWGSGSVFDCDYATVKYDSEGSEVWAAGYDGPAHDWDEPVALAVSDPNCVYVTGCSEGVGTSGDYATVKYDGDGNEVWVARYNGPGNGLDDAYDMAVDRFGNIYVTGCSDNLSLNPDYATIKYSPQGTCLAQITGDINRDCVVDLGDLAILAVHWLDCNLDPPDACSD